MNDWIENFDVPPLGKLAPALTATALERLVEGADEPGLGQRLVANHNLGSHNLDLLPLAVLTLDLRGEVTSNGWQEAADTRYLQILTVALHSATFRRNVFDRLGLFDETLAFSEDLDFFFRLAEAEAPLVIETEIASLYRRHLGSMTMDTSAVKAGMLAALQRSLARRTKHWPHRASQSFLQPPPCCGGRPCCRRCAWSRGRDLQVNGRRASACAPLTIGQRLRTAFNAERTIGAAVESTLNQTRGPQVVIVVDDGSTDRTAECARAFGERVTVIRQSNRGCGAATTRGLDAVATPFVACLDADDLWIEEKAALQMQRLAAVAELDAVFSLARLFKHGETPRADAPVQEVWGRTTMLIRTASARRVGPVIDPAQGRGDMVDWIARARELGIRLEMMPKVLALRRIVPGSLSYGRDARDYGYLQAVKAALDRRRSGT